MDLLTAILACNLYTDDQLVLALAAATSRGNPYSVINARSDLDPTTTPQPSSVALGFARMSEIDEAGGAPLVGLLAVPPKWASVFGRAETDLFDACTNLSIATAMLSNFDRECVRPNAKQRERAPTFAAIRARRDCTLRRYADAIGYEFLPGLVTLECDQRHSQSLTTKAAESPIFLDTASQEGRLWGMDRIFFQRQALENWEPQR